MIELKQFAFNVEQMRMAQIRYDELKERFNTFQYPDDLKAANDVKEMKRQLEIVVDDSLREIKKASLRIMPEQVDADASFRNALKKSLQEWKSELSIVQLQSVEQAIDDGKAGAKSERYTQLEKREHELKANIVEAEQKLGIVSDRIANPSFAGTVDRIVNSAKP